MSDPLAARVAAMLARPLADEVRAFGMELARETGAQAVLFYGSNLRTGELDGVLDYYALLPTPAEHGIWPRVSYHEWDSTKGSGSGRTLRAKVAAMSGVTFAEAAAGRLLDTTIWARFVQPSALVWAENDAARATVVASLMGAAVTAARLAIALGPVRGDESEYWRALFAATYRAEFRVEKPGREDSILALNRDHFAGLLPLALNHAGMPYAIDASHIAPEMSTAQRRRILRWWGKRRRWGKPLNLMRLVRAATTFDGAARYAAWKIERHTGVPVPLTPWRERHPVLAAPGVLWRVWRARRNQGRNQG